MVDTFRATGDGWQTRIAGALRKYVAKHLYNSHADAAQLCALGRSRSQRRNLGHRGAKTQGSLDLMSYLIQNDAEFDENT